MNRASIPPLEGLPEPGVHKPAQGEQVTVSARSTAVIPTPPSVPKPASSARDGRSGGRHGALERDWLQEKLGNALAIPSDTVGKFLLTNKQNGYLATSLFLPFGPNQGENNDEEAHTNMATERRPSQNSTALITSVLGAKTFKFLQKETDHSEQLRQKGTAQAFAKQVALTIRGDESSCSESDSEDDSEAAYPEPEDDLGDIIASDETALVLSTQRDERDESDSIISISSSVDLQEEALTLHEAEQETGVDVYEKKCKELEVHMISYLVDNLQRETLSLSQHLVGDIGGIAVAEALAVNEYITTLSLVNCNLGHRSGIALGKMLELNQQLVAIDLSNNSIGNASWCEFAKALESNTCLQTIVLSNVKFGDKATAALSESLLENESSVVRHLDLSKNQITQRSCELFGQVLSSNKQLTHLDLGWNNLRGKGASRLLEACTLCEDSKLEYINLGWNGIDDTVSAMAAKLIETSSVLKYLDLSHNKLSVATATLLAGALAKTTCLRSLQIGYNPIGAAGCIKLIEALRENESLRLLGTENPLGQHASEELLEKIWVTANEVLEVRKEFAQVTFQHPERQATSFLNVSQVALFGMVRARRLADQKSPVASDNDALDSNHGDLHSG